MARSDRKKRGREGEVRVVGGMEGGVWGALEEVRETGRGFGVPPTIESMREPRKSRSEAPEMGGIGDTLPWNRGNPHSHSGHGLSHTFSSLDLNGDSGNLPPPSPRSIFTTIKVFTRRALSEENKRCKMYTLEYGHSVNS